MHILHYSDKSSPEFLKLYAQCDVLFTTGDLTFFDFSGLQEIEHKKPAFGVYGNHDSGLYMEELGIINLHNKVVEFNNLKLGGFQGCIKYKESDMMYTEHEANIWASSFPYVDILFLHAGPLGMLDDPSDSVHIGSESIRKYVLEKEPKYVFLGHQYSDDFIQQGNTKLYRSYGARLIEVTF